MRSRTAFDHIDFHYMNKNPDLVFCDLLIKESQTPFNRINSAQLLCDYGV